MIAVIFTAITFNSGPMEIQRPGYLLREWRATDCTSLAHYADNIKIWRNVRDRFPTPIPKRTDVFSSAISFRSRPAMNSPSSLAAKRPGGIGLVRQSDVERLSAEIGYWIGEPYWNRSIAGDAVGTVCEYAFRENPADPFVRIDLRIQYTVDAGARKKRLPQSRRPAPRRNQRGTDYRPAPVRTAKIASIKSERSQSPAKRTVRIEPNR